MTPPGHATASSHSTPLKPTSHSHACAVVLQVPLLEHVSVPPRQKSQGRVLHAIDSDGLGQSSQSASSARAPLSSVTHVQVRVLIPPPQSALQEPHSDADQRTVGAQRAVLHTCSANEARTRDQRGRIRPSTPVNDDGELQRSEGVVWSS
eukprot:747605-Pyramimonas_sp.AAC.1